MGGSGCEETTMQWAVHGPYRWRLAAGQGCADDALDTRRDFQGIHVLHFLIPHGQADMASMEGVEQLQERRSDLDELTQTPYSNSFAFTEKEKTILALWDAEQELLLERRLLEGQGHGAHRHDWLVK